MIKRNYRSILLVAGILVALVIINYNCLTPVETQTIEVRQKVNPVKNGYMAAITDLMFESAKALIRPVGH